MKNLVFVPRGPDVAPYAHPPRASLVEVVWHPDSIRALERGTFVSNADAVIVEPDRAKRKFVCFADSFAMFRDFDHVALVDDDLALERGTWDDVFAAMARTPLVVAQAALTEKSTHVWPVTQVDRECSYRVTDFVEVMAPVFTRAALERAMPYFLEERYGWGLEAMWSALFAPIGILDAVPMVHTRPIGSAFSMTGLEGYDAHPEEMGARFRKKHGWRMPLGVTLERRGKLGELLELVQRCGFAGCREPRMPLSALCVRHRWPDDPFSSCATLTR